MIFKEEWLAYSEGIYPREFGKYRDKVEDQDGYLKACNKAIENYEDTLLNVQVAFNRFVKCELPYLDKVFIDLDGKFDKSYEEMKRIYAYLRLHFTDPLILFTGNRGFHIYISFLPIVESEYILSESLKILGQELKERLNLGTLDSSVFEVKRLARIPFSIHPKSARWCVPVRPWLSQEEIIKLSMVPKDCTIPIIFNKSDNFRAYFLSIIDKVNDRRHRTKNVKTKRSTNSKTYSWIEDLLQNPISDGRHRVLWLILAPYLITIKGLSEDEATSVLEEYYAKCGQERPLHSAFNRLIKYFVEHAKRHGLLPITLERLREKDSQLYEIVARAVGIEEGGN